MIVGQPDPLTPGFPPLFRGEGLAANLDPMTKAIAQAMKGVDPGLVVWSQDTASARAALVLAPEMSLEQSMAVLFAAELGLADALGSLAPPEVAIHFSWPTGLKVNGAKCGGFRIASSTDDPTNEPDWLVVEFNVPIIGSSALEGGERPNETALAAEGCGELTAAQIIDSWSRHTLVWINTLLEDGFSHLHESWRAKCDTVGEEITLGSGQTGVFMGLDELGGLLLKTTDGTTIVPLSNALETKT